ncbi:response regulator transcription factor [Streptomyces tsukubensis]|uniref:DNA-binding response regulator n=1 Tax=Streptomyces tsukubensis TaxID=83656 RepID=A0A1V4AD09_9ACTN|nr:response regulator transcription factor [Streptomyces tsukubensis]OON81379.1 DNA-binding response regulator [Streptomyces tsukubensis]QFR95497.1 response regulator [Streptomyces tsukubensis]
MREKNTEDVPWNPAPAQGPSLRIVIADDNPVVRAGLRALLEDRTDIRVVAEAADGGQALTLVAHHRPDVVLLDVRMPGVDGMCALPRLARTAPVLMLTYSAEPALIQQALRLGAAGYLVHGEFTAPQLVAAVRDVRGGRATFTPSARDALPTGGRPEMPGVSNRPGPSRNASHLQSSVPESFPERSRLRGAPSRTAAASPQPRLSEREVEVMDLIASGMSNRQIAATCFISEKTVKNHINRIFAKLHSATRSEAIALWLGTTHAALRMGAAPHA